MDKRRRTHPEGKKFSEKHTSAAQFLEGGNRDSPAGEGESLDNLRQEEINLNHLLKEIRPSLNYFMNAIIEFVKGANIIVSALLSGNYRKKIENLNVFLPWLISIISRRLSSLRGHTYTDGENLINAVIKGLEEEASEIINNHKSDRDDIFKAEVLKKVVEILKKQMRVKKENFRRVNIE